MYNPEDRISAEEALNDKWIQSNYQNNEENIAQKCHQPIMLDILNNIKTIHVFLTNIY